jgi:hypothetical protein
MMLCDLLMWLYRNWAFLGGISIGTALWRNFTRGVQPLNYFGPGPGQDGILFEQ